MAESETPLPPARDGMSRRDMIRASAAAGAVAWTAPVIIDSLTSPAAATSGGLPTTCSYALVVFNYAGAGPYIMKIQQGSAACSLNDASTSNDTSFSGASCSTATYLYAGGKNFNQVVKYSTDGGTTYNTFPSLAGHTCGSLFTVSNTTITANDPNVTILFGVSHYGNAFHPACPSGSKITVQCSGGA